MIYSLYRKRDGITLCLGEFDTAEHAVRVLRGIKAKWYKIADAEPMRKLRFRINAVKDSERSFTVLRKLTFGKFVIEEYMIKREIA